MTMRITLRQLDVFCAVCRNGGVGAAAIAVAMSQSAASEALSELESALDGPLFDRVGRRLQRNARGDVLYPRAVELLERAREIESVLRDDTIADETPLRLCASLTIGSYLLPGLLGPYTQTDSTTRIMLDAHNTAGVIEAVASLRADAGFIEGSCRHPDLRVHRWRNDRLCVVAAPRHLLARKRRVLPADLAAARWVLREPGSGTREVFEQAMATAGISVVPVLQFAQTEAVKRAVRSGTGLGCLSELAVMEELARGDLHRLRTPFLPLERPLVVITHRRKYLSPALRAVLTACGVVLQS
jgi:DNA-binding transcriptional LysR family regulator